jgi:hypothetical protein
MGSYWFSVLRVLFCLPLFFVLCPLLNASLLVVGVVCFALFAFVLCLVSTVVCFVLFAFVLCLVPTVACVFIGVRCCLFCFVCLCSVLCPLLLVSLLEFGVVCFVLFAFVLSCVHCCLCLYWNSVLSVLLCLPLFYLVYTVACVFIGIRCCPFGLFAFVLCFVSTVDCVFIGIRCCLFCFVCLCAVLCPLLLVFLLEFGVVCFVLFAFVLS